MINREFLKYLKLLNFIALLFLVSFSGIAQFALKIPFVQVLNSIQSQYGVTFSYNSTLLAPLQTETPPEEIGLSEKLHYLEEHLPVRFDSIDEREYIIVPIRMQLEFRAIDNETQKDVYSLFVTVNHNGKKYLLPHSEKFTLPDIFPTDSLTVESQFYKTEKFSVSKLKANENNLMLTPAILALDEVSIVSYIVSGIDSRLSDHSLVVDMKKLGLLAGETDGDVFQLLKSMPGINAPSGKPGNLSIRNNTFSQNQIYFDNIPIYHKGHFFGTISPYNTGILDEIKVYRGTLPARWGGRVGGLMDMHTSEKVPALTRGGISANTVYTSAQLNLPIIKNKVGLAFSARSNYPFETLSPKMQQYSDLNFQGSSIGPDKLDGQNKLDNLDIRFNDINGKLIYDINRNHSVSLSFIRIINNFNSVFHSISRNSTETVDAQLNNWGLSGKWNGKINPKLYFSVVAVRSNLENHEKKYETGADTVRKHEEMIHSLADDRITAEVRYEATQNLKITIGYEYSDQQIISEEIREMMPPVKNNLANTHTVYTSINKIINQKLITNIGLHSDYYSPLSKWYIDPRLSMSYLVTKYLAFKASGGRSHQFVNQDFLPDFEDFLIANQFWRLASDKQPPLEGYQAMVGSSLDIGHWIVDLELYAKKTNNVSKIFDHVTGTVPIGSLSSRGADFFIKRRWNKLEAWTSYSISKTTSEFEENTMVFFDQTHSVNLMFIMNLNRWKFAASWNYATGMPVILPDLSTINNPNPDAPLSIDTPYTNRFPDQHQLDFSVTYQLWPDKHRFNGVLGLSLLNLYNRHNIINLFQKNINSDNLYRYAVGFSPNIQLSIFF